MRTDEFEPRQMYAGTGDFGTPTVLLHPEDLDPQERISSYAHTISAYVHTVEYIPAGFLEDSHHASEGVFYHNVMDGNEIVSSRIASIADIGVFVRTAQIVIGNQGQMDQEGLLPGELREAISVGTRKLTEGLAAVEPARRHLRAIKFTERAQRTQRRQGPRG